MILSTRAPIGHLAINTVPMAFNQGCRGLVPGNDLLVKYLFFFLGANVGLLNELGTGTTFKELSAGALAAVAIPVPPLAEQQRIVAILDEAFEAIANATANTEKNFANARELFSTKLDETFDQLPGKSVAPLSSLCRVFGDGDWIESKDQSRAPIRLVQTGNVGTGLFKDRSDKAHYISEATFTRLRCTEVFEGDVLISRLPDPVGRACLLPNTGERMITAVDCTITRFKTDRIIPEFFCLFSQTRRYAAAISPLITGTTRARISRSQLARVEVPVPNLTDQKAVLAALQKLRCEIDTLESSLTRKLADLAELKQSLLARAFSGELTASASTASVLAPANDNAFATPGHVANIIAFAHQRHEAAGRQKTFGRVKAQKNLHLVESVGRVELGRQPWKDAAGPNDFPHMLRAEAWAKERGFFEFRARTDGGYDFKKLANYATMMAAAKLALAPIRTEVSRVTDLLTPLDSVGAEVLATVHAAWNNLILDGAEATDDAIVREARDDWHESKLKIAESKFREAIKLIRKKGIIPDGSAKRVAEQLKLL